MLLHYWNEQMTNQKAPPKIIFFTGFQPFGPAVKLQWKTTRKNEAVLETTRKWAGHDF